MRCNYCGAEINKEMKYCPVCGKELGKAAGSADHGAGTIFQPSDYNTDHHVDDTDIVIEPVGGSEKEKEKKPKKGKKLKRILIMILVVVLVVVVGGGAFFFTSSAKEVVNNIDKGNITTAQQVYDNGVEDKLIEERLFKFMAEKKCNTALEQFQKGKKEYKEVNELLEDYKALDADEIEIFLTEKTEVLSKLNASMEAYEKAEKLYTDGKYAEAMENYSQVIEDDTNYEDAQEKLSDCVEKYTKDILEGTKKVETIEEYEEAIETLTIALQIVEDNEELSNRLEELEKEYAALLKSEALSHGTEYIKDGKFQELFELLKKACEKNSGDKELNNLQKTAEDEYVKVVQETVDGFLADDQYDEAVKYLKEAVKILDTNTKLKELLTEVQENVPVELSSMKISESKYCEAGAELSVMEDSIGNVYSPGNLYKLSPYNSTNPAYATIYLKGEYTRVKGIIAVADDSVTSDTGKVSILDEKGKVLYTSGTMSRTTAPISIDVDLSGVEWMTISCENDEGYDFRAFVTDWVFFKD